LFSLVGENVARLDFGVLFFDGFNFIFDLLNG
jgi:hypothetical protein